VRAGPALEDELRCEEPFIGLRRDHLAVAHPILGGLAPAHAPAAVDRLHRTHVRPGLSAKGPGVHGQCATEGARNTRKELRRSQPPLDALPRDARAGGAGFTAHAGFGEPLERIECAVGADDDAAQAAIAHQQIAAEPDPVNGHLCRYRPQEGGEILAIARIEEDLGRPADVPGGVPAERLIAPHARGELGGERQVHALPSGGNSAASAAGSA